MEKLEIAALLDEEEVIFEPVAGVFDVGAVADKLGGLASSFRDEHDTAMFVVAADEEDRLACQASRRAAPDGGYPPVPLVHVQPDRIVVSPVGVDPYAALSMRILEWLIAWQPCRIINDHGTDVTDAITAGMTS